MKRVLFVCTGNTCRSPMAAAILKHKANDRYDVKSAGLFALNGQPAQPHALAVLHDNNIEFKHSSRQLTSELVDWADIILTMTENHKHALIQQFPKSLDKVETLKGYLAFQEQWDQWKEARADYELKKAIVDNESRALDEEAQKEFQHAYERIQQLEKSSGSMDIVDPFGSSKHAYNAVFTELEELIDRFLENDV